MSDLWLLGRFVNHSKVMFVVMKLCNNFFWEEIKNLVCSSSAIFSTAIVIYGVILILKVDISLNLYN